MCVKTQQQEKSKDSESIVNHSQDLTLNNTAQDTLPLPTQDVKSTTHNQKPQKTFSESSKKEESSEDISQLLKSKTDQKDEKSEGITPVNTQALPEVKETVASDNLSITPKEKKQEVVMTMNKNVDKDISQLNTPSETQDVKKRPLKIDDLIFELRHPEVVLQRAQSQDQDNDIKVKADVLATRNMEKVQSIQNQFLSAMKTIVDRHEEKMIIHLDPPEWGKIDVQLKLQNKELNVQIRTEQAFVKESLEKGVPELRQAFSGQGLQLDHLIS